jgi:tricorn protease
MHGLDWDRVGDHYRRLLDDAVTRWDVNFVLRELIGELNASHTYVGGGDTEEPQRRPVGVLGIDWSLDNGAYRIARIVDGAVWDAESRSALAAPGLEVHEGDYILAVNSAPIDITKEPHAAFAGLAGKTVELTVNDKPSLEGARKILVETMHHDRRLRQLDWIESNRRRVAEATDGRVGYVYVPNTSVFGQSELVRQYTSQALKDGLIVDERWNGGGQLPDRFVELISRQRVAYLFFRHGPTTAWPAGAHVGPRVMLINGWAGSGGDAFPLFFREMGAGPIIGERTWGGLIGPAFGHRLIDGGRYTAPPGRIYRTDGRWFAEGHGVEPDIPVVDDPGQLARGTDPQLEAAITEVLRLLETETPEFTDPPAFEPRVP